MKKSGLLIKAIEEKCEALEFDIKTGAGGNDEEVANSKLLVAKAALSVAKEPSEKAVKSLTSSLEEHADDPDFQYFKKAFGTLAVIVRVKAEIRHLSEKLDRMENGLLATATRIINKALIVLLLAMMPAISLADSYMSGWVPYLFTGAQIMSMMLLSGISCHLLLDWGRRKNGFVSMMRNRLLDRESQEEGKGVAFGIGLTLLLLIVCSIGLYLTAVVRGGGEPYALTFPVLFSVLSLANAYSAKTREPLEEDLMDLRRRYEASRRLLEGK